MKEKPTDIIEVPRIEYEELLQKARFADAITESGWGEVDCPLHYVDDCPVYKSAMHIYEEYEDPLVYGEEMQKLVDDQREEEGRQNFIGEEHEINKMWNKGGWR